MGFGLDFRVEGFQSFRLRGLRVSESRIEGRLEKTIQR